MTLETDGKNQKAEAKRREGEKRIICLKLVCDLLNIFLKSNLAKFSRIFVKFNLNSIKACDKLLRELGVCVLLSEELVALAKSVCRLKTETQTVEVKAAHLGCPKRLYDTLSSFSNQDSGGIILFGIDEEQGFKPVGVYDLNDLQKKVTEQCKQMVPQVRAFFTVAEYEGAAICCAEIPSLDMTDRPCYYSGVGKAKGSFVRVGDADLLMTDYEIYSYESFRKRQHDDERPVERAKLSMLNGDKLQNYLLQMKIDRPGFSQLEESQAFEMLAITRDDVPTLAAVLNFGLYPQGYFPQLAITAISIPGTEIGDQSADHARFLDNRRIEGTLSDMLTEALGFCRRNMKIKTVLDPKTAERTDCPEYPIEAIREAVLNALIHRDYSIYTEGTPIQIDFFTDRLEIHSPGGLYGRLTVEELGHSRPDLRNPALATMAEFLLKTENRYSGIPTIRRELRKAGLPEPVFQNRRNEFVVIFYNAQPKQEDTLPDIQEKDLLVFCKTPRSRKEIAEYLGLSSVSYAITQYAQPLVNAGKLKMTIPQKPKSTYQMYVTA